MDWRIAAAAALAGYLLGSISFARIAVRLSGKPVDIGHWEVRLPNGETFTSDIVSATSVRLALGPRYGCLVSALDMAKVAIPTLALRGAISDVLSPQTFDRMATEKPDLVRVTVAGRGHPPMLDEPDSVAAIDAFLARLDADVESATHA